jgi:hypothetical protein
VGLLRLLRPRLLILFILRKLKAIIKSKILKRLILLFLGAVLAKALLEISKDYQIKKRLLRLVKKP